MLEHDGDDGGPDGDGGAAAAPVVHLPWGDADEAGEGGLRDIRACQQSCEGDAGEGCITVDAFGIGSPPFWLA